MLEVLHDALEQWPPTFLAPGASFMQNNFSQIGVGVGFRMIQASYIYCVLYFYCYYISSTSDRQGLGPGGWGPVF